MRRADLLEKTLMLGKTEGKEKGVTEDEIFGWHFQLNGHESEQTPGDSEAGEPCMLQSMGGGKKSDRTDLLTEQQQLGEHGL